MRSSFIREPWSSGAETNVYSLGMEAMHMVEAVRRRKAANAVLVLCEQLVTETTQPS